MDQQTVVYPYNGILFSSEKKNEVPTHATTCMNLTNIKLRNLQEGKIYRDRTQISVFLGLGEQAKTHCI